MDSIFKKDEFVHFVIHFIVYPDKLLLISKYIPINDI